MRCVVTIAALLLVAAISPAQQSQPSESDARARDLSNMFYTDTLPAKQGGSAAPVKAAQATPVKRSARAESSNPPTAMQRRVGLKLSVLLHDRDCNVQQVPATRVFQSGEQIRLQIESNVDGYLSVLEKGSSGNEMMLFPDPRINGGRNQVQRGVQYSIPPTDWFTFNDQPGEENLLIIVSREPLTWLPKPSASPGTQPHSPPVQMLAALNAVEQSVQPRDLALVEEKAPQVGAQPQSTQSTIVLNTSTRQNDMVYYQLTLRHR